MSEFLRPPQTNPTPKPRAGLEVEFPGSTEEILRLWKKYRGQPHAKDLVGLEFQEWKHAHGYPSDLDEDR